jgi:hypothetical protein
MIEKIMAVFCEQADVPGFSRMVSAPEIEASEFNLSVRPYIDQDQQTNALTDVTAIISGGVPRREVKAAKDQFLVFGIDPESLFPRQLTAHTRPRDRPDYISLKKATRQSPRGDQPLHRSARGRIYCGPMVTTSSPSHGGV